MYWVVDGMNVVGARPDGWWHDRGGAMADLVVALNAFHDRGGEPVVVVFDGRERPEVAARAVPGVEVRFAGGAPDAADDAITALVAEQEDISDLCVATSDRDLAERVGALGAEVVGAGTFRHRVEQAARDQVERAARDQVERAGQDESSQ